MSLSDLVSQQKNIFLTGKAGTGKTYLINELKMQTDKQLCLTSTTGISAYHIGGQTIHSFSGIGVIKTTFIKDIVKKIKKNKATKRIIDCEILVIDEISMLGKTYLTALSESFKVIRKNSKAFGGIQVILTGDFYQLPPINDDYAFESEAWTELNLHTILLEKVYRFTDELYSNILSRIRIGKHTFDDNIELFKRVKSFQELETKTDADIFEIKPTFLSSKRIDVSQKNKEELIKNPNELVVYLSRDDCKDPSILSLLDLISPKTLELKVGAQVMLTINKNVEEGLCNGARGVIVELSSDHLSVKFMNDTVIVFGRHDFKYEEDDKVIATRLQFPFILAYCLSIHKCQGSTLDCAVIDAGYSIFEKHMVYVALSRVKSLTGLYLTSFRPDRISIDPKVSQFYLDFLPL